MVPDGGLDRDAATTSWPGAATGKRRRANSGRPQASAKSVSSHGEPWTSSLSQFSRTATTIIAASRTIDGVALDQDAGASWAGRYSARRSAPSAARTVRLILGDDGAPPAGGHGAAKTIRRERGSGARAMARRGRRP